MTMSSSETVDGTVEEEDAAEEEDEEDEDDEEEEEETEAEAFEWITQCERSFPSF